MVKDLPQINDSTQAMRRSYERQVTQNKFRIWKLTKVTELLQLVPIDIAILFKIIFLDGNMHFITFIDDYNRKI